jgi:multicomponent Na+:H+ antiporter subunit C
MLIDVVGVWLILAGIYGLLTARHLVCTTACLSVAQSGTYLILLGLGYAPHGAPPIANAGLPAVAADPVLQALTVTDIVVSAAVTALLLSITVAVHKRTGTVDPEALGAGSR